MSAHVLKFFVSGLLGDFPSCWRAMSYENRQFFSALMLSGNMSAGAKAHEPQMDDQIAKEQDAQRAHHVWSDGEVGGHFGSRAMGQMFTSNGAPPMGGFVLERGYPAHRRMPSALSWD